jgi:hypothetical protein
MIESGVIKLNDGVHVLIVTKTRGTGQAGLSAHFSRCAKKHIIEVWTKGKDR